MTLLNKYVEELRDSARAGARMPEKVMSEAQRDLKRLELPSPRPAPEYSLLLSYLELLVRTPLGQRPARTTSTSNAPKKSLDRDHFGLDKVKRRLIEYLAVRKLNPEGRGPILCSGRPARCRVRPASGSPSPTRWVSAVYARLSLGGIRDEAEVRGHRRTYIGAMPGRIIQELRRAGTQQPRHDARRSSTNSGPISVGTRPAPCSKCSTRARTTPSSTATSTSRSTCRSIIFIATANYMDAMPHVPCATAWR